MKFKTLGDTAEKLLAPFFAPPLKLVSFHSIFILSGLLLAFWPWEGLIRYMTQHGSPLLFSGIGIPALLINAYLSLCYGRGEMTVQRRRAKGLGFEEQPDAFLFQLARCFLYPVFWLLPVLPLGILATTVSGVALLALGQAGTLIYTAAVLCDLFGLLMSFGQGRVNVIGYVGARIFFMLYMFGAPFWTPQISPILIIYHFNRSVSPVNLSLTSSYGLYMVTMLPAIGLLTLVNWIVATQTRRYEKRIERG